MLGQAPLCHITFNEFAYYPMMSGLKAWMERTVPYMITRNTRGKVLRSP